MVNKIVRLENVIFSYDKTTPFIENLSFCIDKGTYTCILGSNGSGKTTVAKLIGGLLNTDRGDVFIDGILLNHSSMQEIRDYIGVIFQNPDNQYVATTLKEDIIFGLENHNINSELMDDIVDRVSRECDVFDLLNKDPSSMSGGEKQKGAIAGVLAMNPKVLILDESSSMLDPVSKKELLYLIHKLKEEKGLTVISITHDANEILLSDKIIVLDNGKMVFEGNKEQFYNTDVASYNIELPKIMQLEKGLGYSKYIGEEEFFKSVGEEYEN